VTGADAGGKRPRWHDRKPARSAPQASGPTTAPTLTSLSTTPRATPTRVTYTGNGYADGYREGQKADIGGAKLRSRPAGAIAR